ncbi:MAG TPA: aromatic ring-hydroxylating dioxygenase subunit alpha [Steroidobacteraceae bacterium]|nr:aromatic ring-hydroxylating dioxygenase subunit alpha [Steroidobacteraceae bacterium]
MSSQIAEWSVEDQEGGYSLPARFFYDESVFQREKTQIFFKSWHLVAHLNELAEPGSYVTRDIFEQSVLVVAGRDGELRAFHNVCQHRGNRLVESRRGTSPTFTCGYHAWSYALDGCLRGAPNASAVAGFKKSEHGLKPVRLERFASFVFVNLDAHAKPIAEMARGAEAQIRRFLPDLDRLRLIEEIDVPVDANWKVIQENSIEGYHFDYSGPAHKQLVQLIDFAGYTLEAHGEWWTYIGPPKQSTREAYGVALEGATWQTDWFFNFGLWPNVTLYAFPYADMVGTFIMIPTGPETSTLRFGYYGVAGRDLPRVTEACIRWMNQDLGPEDIRLNRSNQKGLRSLGFERGRYLIGEGIGNRSEHLVRHFHKLCYDAVRS